MAAATGARGTLGVADAGAQVKRLDQQIKEGKGDADAHERKQQVRRICWCGFRGRASPRRWRRRDVALTNYVRHHARRSCWSCTGAS